MFPSQVLHFVCGSAWSSFFVAIYLSEQWLCCEVGTSLFCRMLVGDFDKLQELPVECIKGADLCTCMVHEE